MAYKCVNGNSCPYGPQYEDDEYNPLPRMPADAYSQNQQSWKAGTPNFYGLCLNCLDDRMKDSSDVDFF